MFYYRMNTQYQMIEVSEEVYNLPADTEWFDFKFKGYVLPDNSDIILEEIIMKPVRLSRREYLESSIKGCLNYLQTQYSVNF